ncbi:chorismate mutase 1, chloroplastic-like isoform X4 [Camellia sinensis]|uniref:chorismate mutase 1, chloroplastic-like isoform X4 n=1 Tax=Camellia sinensis TaxID=4442 RepID=UPI0010360973|nr:chorismate mutase 1, chloroplastic-like isoform X4 [Camellia sinensis]
MDGFHGSVDFMVKETEKLHARALSKRIHYGKFVAEAKFRASPDAYEAAIRAQVYILFFRCTQCIHSFRQDSTDGFADVSHCGRGDKE